MELQAVVRHGGAFAYYTVIPETKGTYSARLVRYYGPRASAPPDRLLLARGVRKWVGSDSEQELLNDLGRIIETSLPEEERVLTRKRSGEPTNPDAG